MQERWRLNAASSYEDPVVRVRKRLVTAAWKLRKLAETDFPPRSDIKVRIRLRLQRRMRRKWLG